MVIIPYGSGITLQGVSTIKSLSAESATTGNSIQDQTFRNPFLSCRMFWSDEVYRSCICWGTFDPEFHFVQVYFYFMKILINYIVLKLLLSMFRLHLLYLIKLLLKGSKIIGLS